MRLFQIFFVNHFIPTWRLIYYQTNFLYCNVFERCNLIVRVDGQFTLVGPSVLGNRLELEYTNTHVIYMLLPLVLCTYSTHSAISLNYRSMQLDFDHCLENK
jgi:hypothetical protein